MYGVNRSQKALILEHGQNHPDVSGLPQMECDDDQTLLKIRFVATG